MHIHITELIDGARHARGLTVIIDVFRAFTTECYAFAGGAARSYPIGSLDDAFALKAAHPDWLLLGERGGAKVEGCDLGNSPYDVTQTDFRGKTLIHSTSAGTQGIVAAAEAGATEIITGSLVNARAVCAYVRSRVPDTVTIVAMGKAGTIPINEDRLCAYYMAFLLSETQEEYEEICRTSDCLRTPPTPEATLADLRHIETVPEAVPGTATSFNADMVPGTAAINTGNVPGTTIPGYVLPDRDTAFSLTGKIAWLKNHGGQQFFDPATIHIFPREDYPLCVACNHFPFVLKVGKEEGRLIIEKNNGASK